MPRANVPAKASTGTSSICKVNEDFSVCYDTRPRALERRPGSPRQDEPKFCSSCEGLENASNKCFRKVSVDSVSKPDAAKDRSNGSWRIRDSNGVDCRTEWS